MDGRVDLVGGISPDHMLNSFVAARMVLHPSINLEDMLVQDNNGPAICYEAFDLPRGHDGVLTGWCPTLAGVHGGVSRQFWVGLGRAGQLRLSFATDIEARVRPCRVGKGWPL